MNQSRTGRDATLVCMLRNIFAHLSPRSFFLSSYGLGDSAILHPSLSYHAAVLSLPSILGMVRRDTSLPARVKSTEQGFPTNVALSPVVPPPFELLTTRGGVWMYVVRVLCC